MTFVYIDKVFGGIGGYGRSRVDRLFRLSCRIRRGNSVTCIIGIATEARVYIGADSAAVSGWTVRPTALPKVFRLDLFLIGYTTSFRMGQILQYHLSVAPQEDESDMQYMVVTFAESVRACLNDHGFATIKDNEERGGQFLVGYKGHLYCIESDYQVAESAEGFDACGSGTDFALGAMQALEQLPPRERIRKSLEISARFCGSVLAPFRVLYG